MSHISEQDVTRFQLLRKVELFSLLDEAQILLLCELSSILPTDPGEVVFRKGDKAISFFIVLKGEVSIYDRLDENTDTEDEENYPAVARFEEGEIFGELEFLQFGQRSAYAVAGKKTEIIQFPAPGTDLDIIFSRHSRLLAKIYPRLITTNAKRLRQIHNLITEKAGWLEELKLKMYRDKLTGVYNRTFLEDELARNPEKLLGDSFSVLVIKPDNFKTINDTFGHEAGDLALQAIAGQIIQISAGAGLVIRYRGNEFIIACAFTPLNEAMQLAEECLSGLSQFDIGMHIGEESLFQTFSIGVAKYPDHEADLMLLVELAYAKVFVQRELGGNGIQVGSETKSDLNQFLQTVDIFKELKLPEIDSLARILTHKQINAGEVICRENEPGEELFLIKDGLTAVTIDFKDGGQRTKEIAEIGPGEFFGEMAIFENAPRSATCIAKEDTEICILQKDDFFGLIDKSPNVAINIMRGILNRTHERVNDSGEIVSSLVKWGEQASLRSVTDKLTGVFNRHYLETELGKNIDQARKENTPFSVIMADMDYFREINEGYSHEIGDEYIVEVANIFKEGFRSTDIVARYGGDEFTILLPNTRAREAAEIAETIRKNVLNLTFLDQYDGPDLQPSVSFGLAAYPDSTDNPRELTKLADKALYHAKHKGRNRTGAYLLGGVLAQALT